MRLQGIEFDIDRIRLLCAATGVNRLWLFGSVLTDRFGPESDLDMLVEVDPTCAPGLLALGGLQMDLSSLLGRTVHLTLLAGVPPESRGDVLKKARMLHAA